MKNLSTSLLLIMLVLNTGWAQSSFRGKVSGTIRDVSGNPLEFVTMMLLNSADSSLVKGAVSEPNGKYVIENVAEGNYYVAGTQVGFKKVFSKRFSIGPANAEIVLPDLLMEEDVKLLKEITVETTRPFIEQEIDRMVINVENSIVSSGSNALEVLEKAPGVTIDRQNDQIQLKGKQGVIVLIDGKQTYLSGQDLANLLKNTQSDNIEKIEVITNPSSKYDAAGNTGIINIRMKKNKNFGTNGTAVVGAGIGRYEKANGSLQLNHRVGKINAFGDYSYNYNKSFQINEISRVITHQGNATYLDQYSFRPNKFEGHRYRGGIDYFISKKSTFGVLVTGFFNE
ncbi:hypothetical protein BH23BAC1_BH23BAC1_13450 [soil metagenome]